MKNLLPITLLFLLLTGCSSEEEPGNQSRSPFSTDTPPAKTYIETGDLDEIKSRGQLRVLSLRQAEAFLPRHGDGLYFEQELAWDFAASLDLQPVRVYVDSYQDLIPALIEGRGDLIASNMRITDIRKERVNFTVPLLFTREQIIKRKEDTIAGLKQLKGRSISVTPGTSFIDTLEGIKKSHPYVNYELLSAELPLDSVLDQLSNGTIDLTVADAIEMDVINAYRDDVESAFNLSKEVPLAWAVRPDNTSFLAALNRFLELKLISHSQGARYTGDLTELKKHKVLRLITRNNAASYFLWKGELMGFEYELFKRFAKQQGLRLQVVVAPSHEKMIPMLLRGEGDLIAALLTPNEVRKQQGVVFSRPYMYTSRQLVGRSDESETDDINDLAGRTIVVRRSSDYWQTTQRLINQGIALELETAPETMETEEIIDRVAQNEYDLTLADSVVLDLELTWRDDIKGMMTLEEDQQPIAVALRPSDKELKTALDAFIKKDYRGLHYNISHKKYFQSPHGISKRQTLRIQEASAGHISPYDDIVKKHADEYGFDWRLILAQMYYESRFDPDRKSWVGAKGLMQVMPRTAKAHGFDSNKLADPETGIEAGIVYLDWLRDRFPDDLNVRDRLWFVLASYNAGLGHVRDARRLARKQGWNPDKWFGHVDRAMLLLAKPEYHKKSKHGYVRGSEPVNYVRNINNRYKIYIQDSLTWEQKTANGPASK
jgi:membrane-bound lytic murein transglycosylase F